MESCEVEFKASLPHIWFALPRNFTFTLKICLVLIAYHILQFMSYVSKKPCFCINNLFIYSKLIKFFFFLIYDFHRKIRLISEIFAIVPELFWWGVEGVDLITEAADPAPFEAAEAVALVAIVSSFNLLLGHPENGKFLFQKAFKSFVTLICNIDDLTWVATHHLVDLDLFTF